MGMAIWSLTVNLIVFLWTKWFDNYWRGMIGNFAFCNFRVVRLFLRQAVPLSLGYVMSYSEWEVLYIFAGTMGPAEVAAWGLLGDLWGALEAIGLASADAAEVRVATLLGSNEPKRARYCAHKSLLVCVCVAFMLSLPLAALSSYVPGWFTKDETLQGILRDLVPLVCFGNIAMMFGSVSWTLLGAQGRFGLATAMGFIGSWVVTLPLSAISTLVLGYDLQGVVSSVVIGYGASGALNSYFLMRSNWEKLAFNIQRKNKEDDGKLQKEKEESKRDTNDPKDLLT